MTTNTGLELSVKHIVANLSEGFPSKQALYEFINAPVVRSDKLERLMENVLVYDNQHLARLSLPNTRTNRYIHDIQGVHEILTKYGFFPQSQAFANTSVHHSTERQKNYEEGKVGDMTAGVYVGLNDRNLPIGIVSIEHHIVTKGSHYISYNVHLNGEYEIVNKIREEITATCTQHVPRNASVKSAAATAQGDIEYKDAKDFHKDPQLAQSTFYPWMVMPEAEDPMGAYFEEFLKSNARVLILIGPPGTGKSTFIRTLIAKHKVQATIAYTAMTVKHPKFLSNFLSEQEDDDGLEDGARTPALLVMEDSDDVIRSRELGNQLMAEFLNAADGIASNSHVKMVFSTNLPTTRDIDSALKRPGRCFDILHFRHLTAEQANAARASVGMEPRDFGEARNTTLSIALNEAARNIDEGEISPRFGFAPN